MSVLTSKSTPPKATFVVGSWALLMALTTLSWWLGTDHGFGAGVRVATALVVIIAFGKAWLVGHSFMELRHSTGRLRLVFASWCALTCGVVVGFYFFI